MNLKYQMPTLNAIIIIIVFLMINFSCNKPQPAVDAVTKNENVIQEPTKSSDTFINIPNLAKKSKAEVDAYLGEPFRHTTISPSNAPCPCESYMYKDGNIEVVFMNNIADWITVNHMESIDFDAKTILQKLGIPYSDPAIQRDNVMKWNDFNGYDQLSVFGNGNGKAYYAFLKAITH
ncbi:MAG TPA: hypothetical protein VFG10_16070 [Saprospiraceae bacterium]|nr:hypothetical protein [Saprospiraceae bacterium]